MEALSVDKSFSQLPLDLLPLILGHLPKRGDLRRCLLVSHEWRAVAESLLYRWIRLWGKDLVSILLRPHCCFD